MTIENYEIRFGKALAQEIRIDMSLKLLAAGRVSIGNAVHALQFFLARTGEAN